MFGKIFGVILALISLAFCVIVVVDKTLFDKKLRQVKIGMTGKEIQNETGLKLKVSEYDGKAYAAIARSMFTFFRCKFIFLDGKLVSKQSGNIK